MPGNKLILKVNPRVDCTVIGDALIDVLLPIDGIVDISSLHKGGVVNTKARFMAGGIANITYYVDALGGKAAVICKVGDDYLGKFYTEDMMKHGITTRVSISKGNSTGMSFVLILPGGERFFIDDRGANPTLQYADYDIDMVNNSRYLYISGYSFQDEGFSQDIYRLFKEIHRDVCIVFSPGAPNLAKQYREAFMEVIRSYAGILILNEAEAGNLTGAARIDDILEKLLVNTKIIALTRGTRGSIIANQRERIELDACATTVVDTTGAGDGYAGAFLYGLACGWTLKKAGELACRVAAQVVACQGARITLSPEFARRDRG